jgi:hypothetical protein
LKRVFLKLYQWVILSLILQLSLLLFINLRLVNPKNEITIKAFQEWEQQEASIEEYLKTVKVKKEMENVKFSYDLTYFAYMFEDKLYVQKNIENEVVKEIESKSGQISHYLWMEDRNMLIYGDSIELNQSSEIEISTIDFETEQEKKYPKITSQKKGAKLRWMEVSYLTKVLYAQMVSDVDEKIYSYDIMGNLSFVATVPMGTKIRETKYYDSLFIDENNGKIRIFNGLRNTMHSILPSNEKHVLLDIDKDDYIYVGKLDQNHRVEAILKGKVERASVNDWEKIALDAPEFPNTLIITDDGRILRNDIKKRTLGEVFSKETFGYEGRLIDVREEYYLYREDPFIKVLKFQK